MLSFTPAIDRLLYEDPWPIILVLVVLWAGMRFASRRVSDEGLGKRLRRASWPVLGVMVAVWAVSVFVVTPKEQLQEVFDELIVALESEDHAAFDRLCAKDATAHYGRAEMSRAQIDGALSELTFDDLTVVQGPEVVSMEQHHQQATMTFRLRADVSGGWGPFDGGGLHLSQWTILWEPDAAGNWRAVRFEYIELDSSILQP